MLTSLKTKITFVFFFISYIAIAQWAQVGQDIDGDFLDNAGFSVDLSNNGNLMVIGYPRNDNNGQDSGAVKVFQKNNDTWIQIGTEINGDNSNDQFGTAVSMSGDGLLVAIGNNNGGFSGQVKVFKLQNQNWQQVGSEINGLEVGSLFGRSLSISNDGNNLIVGAPGFYTNTQSGYVEIYQYINNIWQQKGQGIPGANFGDSFGGSVSISDDGLTIAIGAPGNDFIGNGSGLVKIYKYINNNWVQKGNTIYGDTSGDLLGTSLSLSQDGNIIAIGATEGFNINTQSGYAKIFEFNNSIWNQIGGDINGQNVGDLFGFSIDISDNGNTVVIGAIGNNNNGAIAGSTRVFSLTNNVWAQISQNINGENQSDNSGHSVAINSVGNLIAIGARTAKNNNNQPTGHVRVYENPNVSNCNITVDNFSDVNTSNPYTLPALTNGNYFTDQGGLGTALNAGDIISTTQTIYIYNEDPNDPNCNAESSFTITINTPPAQTYVPDDGFETRLQTLGLDSGPLDDYVLTANINTLTAIDLSGAGIADLTGIEGFVALEQLYVENNNLTSVDLSSNTALTNLDINNNQLTALNLTANTNLQILSAEFNQLSSINLNGLNNLQELYIRDNLLTSIDLSNLLGLIIFSGYNNNFTNLDASQNTNLSIFLANSNDLTSLDIRNANNTNIVGNFFTAWANPDLTCIFVDNASYSSSNWTSIDPASTFVENQAQCDALGDTPAGLTYVPDDNFELHLQGLGVDSGPLDDYVLTDNIINMTSLSINNQNISDLTGIEDFNALEFLFCEGNQLTSLDLSNNTNLIWVNSRLNQLTSVDISNSLNLQNLRIDQNNLTSINTSQNPNLITFICDNNELTDGGIDLSSNVVLEDLRISSNNLTVLNVTQNINLKTLWCSVNQINNLDLSMNSQLEYLNCITNQLSTLNVTNNNQLKILHCNYNLLNSLDVTNNDQLEILYCTNNLLANLDLTQNTQLTSLWAYWNPMETIDLRNGNNTIITDFQIQGMGNTLNCVFVDNTAYSVSNWTNVDDSSVYKENESDCVGCSPPAIDTLSDVSACTNYLLPNLTNGNYFTETSGNGTMLNIGDVISTSQTIYIYNEDPNDPSCNAESSFTVTIVPTPNVDVLNDVSACNSFTLPNLTDGAYYSQPNQSGTAFSAGDVITTSQTLYIYNEVNGCSNESSFVITITTEPPVDILPDVDACDEYTLQALTNGNYFTQSGGTGTALNDGDVISATQTIYIYNEDPNDASCSAESSFTITITPTPNVDTLNDTSACNAFTLPSLTDGNYYSQSNQGGTTFTAGDVITTSQTLYIYNEVNGCSNESSFVITITTEPPVDVLPDVEACDEYTLQSLTNGNYFTQSGGTGTSLNEGDVITTTQTIYIYNENPSDASCSAESSFTVTITPTPNVDTLNDTSACNAFTLPSLTDGNYYSQPNQGGTAFSAGDVITTSQTLYIYNEVNGCSNESSFEINITTEPPVDVLPDVDACDDYALQAITNGNYFTQSGGTGTSLNEGDVITTTQTIYIYNEDPSDASCSAESSFTVTITPTPNVDTLNDVSACNSFTLPSLTDGNYYSQSNQGGTAFSAGDVITTSKTLYIYNEVNGCSNESSFVITITTEPPVDILPDVDACDEYTFQALTNGNYFTQSGGTGTALNDGDVISTTQTIYIYNEDPSDGSCSAESSFTVSITPTPNVDTLSDVSACNSFTLPSLTDGNYYSQSNQSGTAFSAGDVITTSQTLYIYNEVNGCSNESSFDITVSPIPNVDVLDSVLECELYELPPLTNGEYFSNTNGNGTQLNEGDIITTSQLIYIFNEENGCTNESSFFVELIKPDVDVLNDVSECEFYILPPLTIGNYFTEPGGQGLLLLQGDFITISETIYIYAEADELANCSGESSFNVEILISEDFTLNESSIIKEGLNIEVDIETELVELEYAVDNNHFQSTNVFTNLSEGDHILYVRGINNCVEKSILFFIKDKYFKFPQFFTPNGDGINDYWIIEDLENEIEKVVIFDRYGKLLQIIYPNNSIWDGSAGGRQLPSSDYWFKAVFFNGKIQTGHVTLKR